MQTHTASTTASGGTLYAANPQRGREMGRLSLKLLAIVRRHPAGISSVGIVGELADDAPANMTQTLANLRQLGHLVNVGKRGSGARWMCARPEKASGATEPHNKTTERAAIEGALLRAGETGATRTRLMALTGLADEVVHRVCRNLCSAGKADLVSVHGGERHYVLVAAVARAQARSKAQAAEPHAAPPARISKMTGVYDPVELRPNPGLTADRFEAFALPSRIGNRLHYPGGRVELLVQA